MTIEVVKNLEGRRRGTGVDVDHGRVKCECACIAANVGGATMGARMNAKGRPPAELSCFIDGASASFELPASWDLEKGRGRGRIVCRPSTPSHSEVNSEVESHWLSTSSTSSHPSAPAKEDLISDEATI